MSEKIKAVISLTIICFVVALTVTLSYKTTKPYIERSANKVAYEAMESVLPETQKFAEIDIPQKLLEEYNCTFIRKSSDSKSVAMQIEGRGYQSELVVMIGLNEDGSISGIKITKHSETEGIGTRAMSEEYLSRYKGKQSANDIELLSGATYTSEGIKNAVNTAFALFNEIKEELNG